MADGLEFPEGPRWHDGRLFFSDMLTGRVHAVGADGGLSTVCEVPARPSGLGFPADGRMLVVSMDDQRLLRLGGGELEEVADLSGLSTGPCNDMVAAPSGRAWVGDTMCLLRVDPDGSASVAAADLRFPNGVELADGGSTLLVAESLGMRVTAFDVAADGTLSGRRAWATFAPAPAEDWDEALGSGAIVPDGICLDASGALWVADVGGHAAVRMCQGGEVLEEVRPGGDLTVLAVALGGEDGRTLFLCAAPPLGTGRPRGDRKACVLATRVAVPGA